MGYSSLHGLHIPLVEIIANDDSESAVTMEVPDCPPAIKTEVLATTVLSNPQSHCHWHDSRHHHHHHPLLSLAAYTLHGGNRGSLQTRAS